MLGHETNFSKAKKTGIISRIFLIAIKIIDHNAMRLEINYKKNPYKNTSMWTLNKMHLNNQ